MRYILVFISVVFLLSSCRNDHSLEGSLVNISGGLNRSKSYEQYNAFFSTRHYLDIIKAEDTAGTFIEPLFLSTYDAVFANFNGILQYSSNSKVRWTYALDSGRFAGAAMCADKNQNIYVIDNKSKIYALSAKGDLLWTYQLEDISDDDIVNMCNLMAMDDGIAAALTNGHLYKLSYQGKLLWKYNSELSFNRTFPAMDNGTIVLTETNNDYGKTDKVTLVKDSKVLKSLDFENMRLLKTAVLYGENIYITAMKYLYDELVSVVYAMDKDLNILWKKEFSIAVRSLSVSENGNIYIAGFNSGIGEQITGVFCLQSTGELLWKQYLDIEMAGDLLLSRENIALSGSKKGGIAIHFIKRDGKGTYSKSVSIIKSPMLLLNPFVIPGGAIAMTGKDRLSIVRIDEPDIDKLLPW